MYKLQTRQSDFKKVSISLDRYEEEFDEFEFTTFKSGMENYLNWYEGEYSK